jgi:hypothetical protein
MVGMSLLVRAASVQFSYTVVDPQQIRNGHKPKVIGDFANNGLPGLGALSAGEGFKLYQFPSWTPYLITTYSNGPGDEDAAVADVNHDGALDIVIGGLNGNTYWLENPLHQGKSPYSSTWTVHQIDFGRPSHDVVVADINRDGKIDVATESGIYLQGATADSWVFVGAPNINRVLEGTSLASLSNDGYLDLIAPYGDGTQLAWFENPLHRGGDPVRAIWTPHLIDTIPGSSGYLTTAVADLNHDGRTDILLCPMYDDGLLVWYEATPGNGSWVKHTIGPVSYVHQGSLQVMDFNGDGQLDVAFAEQEQSATKRVGIFFNQGSGSAWTLQVLGTSGGHNPKAGVVGNDKYPSIWNANHGYYGAPNPLELWRNTGSEVSPPASPVSDDFNSGALNTTLWTPVNPVGDCQFGDDGTHAVISVPSSAAHDLWTDGNFSARLMQPMPNTDVTVEAKFDSVFTAGYQMQGILVQQDPSHYLRFEVYYDGAQRHLFVAGFLGNNPTIYLDRVIPKFPGSFWIRVIRSGQTWTQQWSTDGATFSNAISFSYALATSQVGVHAGNEVSLDRPPAFTAKVDYFHVLP